MNKIFSLVALLVIQVYANAQTITNYTSTDGLPDNDVTCLTHDGNGNMWFGTPKGAVKFDGTTWEVFNSETDSTIPADAITAIAIGNNNAVWIGTDAGAAVFDGTTWSAYTTTDGLGSNRINHIAKMSNGDIWFSEFNGATKYDGASFTAYDNSNGLPFGGVLKITEDTNGDVLMCTGLGGLVIYDGTGFTTYSTVEGLVSRNTTSIALDKDGNKWIGTAKGVTVLSKTNQWVENYTKMLEIPEPDTLNPVEDVAIDEFGTVWVGIYVDYLVTVGGVAFWDNDQWTTIDASDGLVGPTIRQMALDGRGNLWVGTSSGVSRIDNPNTAGVLQKSHNQSAVVYPNPAKSEVHVLLAKSMIATTHVEVYNQRFQVVLTEKVEQGITDVNINISSLTSGLYFVKIGNEIHKLRIE